MAVTMSDVARAVKVSRATVSYVLNNTKPNHVNGATRTRILKTVARLGYARHQTARSLALGRTQTIAFWTISLTTAYYSNVMDFMMRLLEEARYQTHVFGTRDDYAHNWRQEEFMAPPVDGIIAFDTPRFVEDYLGDHAGSAPPIVSMGASYTRAMDYVGVDLYRGVRKAMAHLLQTGRRRIAFAAWNEFLAPDKGRYDAYTDAMRDAGLKPEYIHIQTSPFKLHRADARARIRDYAASHGYPQAILCFNDALALGAYRGLLDIGARVPDDVALVGCDGDEDLEFLEVPISTLVLPVETLCRTAWDFLRKRMANPRRPKQHAMLQPVLAVRESSGGQRKEPI